MNSDVSSDREALALATLDAQFTQVGHSTFEQLRARLGKPSSEYEVVGERVARWGDLEVMWDGPEIGGILFQGAGSPSSPAIDDEAMLAFGGVRTIDQVCSIAERAGGPIPEVKRGLFGTEMEMVVFPSGFRVSFDAGTRNLSWRAADR